MKVTFDKHTALAVLRAARRRPELAGSSFPRCDLANPDPAPHARWTRRRLVSLLETAGAPVGESQKLHIAVSDRDARLKSAGVANTVCATGLPEGSFVEAAPGVVISSPELLFVEMAEYMTEIGHLLLGMELCGGFSRDSADPINGSVTMHVPPVTSASRIRGFLSRIKHVRGLERARESARLLLDDAWSPTESVIAAFAVLPVVKLGYELDSVVLNERFETPAELRSAAMRDSRVPDIMFGDSRVGINYDGTVHFDLKAIARASSEAALNPDDPAAKAALFQVMSEVRAKAVDDIRRNRELMADGLSVFPVVKEDLYEEGGLDAVMLQVITAIEVRQGRRLAQQRRALDIPLFREKRKVLLRSVLPGSRGGVPDTLLIPGRSGVIYQAIGF